MPPVLPQINQRVTVSRGGEEPVPSRVDDESGEEILLASPSIALSEGDPIVLTWESEDGWFSLESSVQRIDEESTLPTVSIAKRGRVSRFSDRRTEIRRQVSLRCDLRVVVTRVVKPGRTLTTMTVELSANAVRFTTSAPFAPGDVMEAHIQLRDGESVTARLKVIRMDTVSGSWRQTCTATFDDILRSDRSRIVAFLESGALAS